MRTINPSVTAIAIIILVIALLPFRLPYGFYTLLRLVVCAYFIFEACLKFDKNYISYKFIISVILAVLFNPLIIIRLGRIQWRFIDIFALVTIILFEKQILKSWLKRK